MLIRDEHFRNLYKQPIIIKNKEFAHQIAQTLHIDSIMEDNLSDDELRERLFSIKIDDEINSILAVPYIDHEAGMSFLVLATASIEDNRATIYKREDFSVWSVSRKENNNDMEFEYLKDLLVNDDFDIEYYSDFIGQLKAYYVNDGVEALRFAEILDESRNEDYPDDLNVFFIKEGLQMERMWVRCEGIVEKGLIEATLLNTPFQDFGVTSGDKVTVFPYQPDKDEDSWVVICDLNR